MISIFSIINRILKDHNLHLVVIPSNRTPNKTIELSKEYFTDNRTVIDVVDKSAYLSSLALSKYLVVTCDSTSMISEAALTGKPVYVAMIPALRNDNLTIESHLRQLNESDFLNLYKEITKSIRSNEL